MGAKSAGGKVQEENVPVRGPFALRSEIITHLIPQKLFRVMITRILRNPARNNSSEIFWRNDKMALRKFIFGSMLQFGTGKRGHYERGLFHWKNL